MNPETTEPETNQRTHRLHAGLTLLRQERAPIADYQPADAPFVEAWCEIRDRLSADASDAAGLIDQFLCAHLGDLADLTRRARDGHGPSPLLDQIELALSTVA